MGKKDIIESDDPKIKNVKKKLEGLTKEQKELLLFRIVTESGLIKDTSEGFTKLSYDESFDVEDVMNLVKVADVGLFKTLITFAMRDNEVKYQDVYAESLKNYNEVLKQYKKLADELNIDSSLDLSHLFTYMLWNGYFSINKKHTYKLEDRLMLPGMYSFDVIKGQGVCLGYAELLHNYLSMCGIDSSLLFCKVPTKKDAISFDYRPQIKRDFESKKLSAMTGAIVSPFVSRLTNVFGNHAVTLVHEDGKTYGYDPTNLCALNIKDASTASIINGTGDFALKPLMTLMVTPHSDPNHLYEKLLFRSIDPALTRKEYIYSFEEFMELINQNINLLDDAYDSVHNRLECINKETDEIGGRSKALRKIRENKRNKE